MSRLALPPGVYTIKLVTGSGNSAVTRTVTNPDKNGEPFRLTNAVPTGNPNQHFFINGSGFIFSRINRNSFARVDTPSLYHESVKRSTTGLGWLINVVRATTDPTTDFHSTILAPDENKNYWAPNSDTTSTDIILGPTGVNWVFTPV